MTIEERKRMNSLCIRIQEEKNYDVFVALMRDLETLVERKDLRFERAAKREWQRTKPWKTVSAVVSKVLEPILKEPGKVEISISGAEELFREVRIENRFTGVDGQPVALKQGVRVHVTIEVDSRESLDNSMNSTA